MATRIRSKRELEGQRRYRAANRDKILARQRQYRAENKVEGAAYQRAWRLANHDKVLASKARYRARLKERNDSD